AAAALRQPAPESDLRRADRGSAAHPRHRAACQLGACRRRARGARLLVLRRRGVAVEAPPASVTGDVVDRSLARRAQRWAALAIALLLLNASLTFENVWPTPAVHWTGAVSFELALCVLAFAAITRWRRRPSNLAR